MPKVKSVKSTGSGHAATTKPNHHTRVPAALKHIPAQVSHFVCGDVFYTNMSSSFCRVGAIGRTRKGEES